MKYCTLFPAVTYTDHVRTIQTRKVLTLTPHNEKKPQ